MQTLDTSKLLKELVLNVKKIATTEDLLIYIAATDGMVELCKELTNNTHEELVESLTSLCKQQGLNPSATLNAISEIMRSLQVNDSSLIEAYQTLEIDSSASPKETKKAFRKLSMRYHPDHSNGEDTTQAFLAIQEAYDAILNNESRENTPKSTSWVSPKKQQQKGSRKQKYKFVYGSTGLIILLIITSVFLNSQNKSRTLQQYKASHTANTQDKISSAKKQQQLVEQALNNFESTKNNPQPNAEIEDKQLAASEISMIEIESVIPPDPALLASLEQPFPFRNTSIQKKTFEASSLKKKDRKTPTLTKEHQKQIPKKQEMEQKIKVLEEKIQFLEKQHAKIASPPTLPVTTEPVELTQTSSDDGKTALLSEITDTADDIPASESPKPSKKFNQTLVIANFLKGFTQTYNQRDFRAHLEHFATDASENNKPIRSLQKAYKNLFDKTSEIKLEIYNYRWNDADDNIFITGAFTARYAYKNGVIKNYQGEVDITLDTDDTLINNELVVKSLNYTLHEK